MRHKEKSGQGGELVAGKVLNNKATENDSANQSYHFCITLCPQLTTVKIIAKQTTNILMVYIWMICLLHMLPPKQKKEKPNKFLST